MKMVMAILHRDDEDETISELHKNKFFVTKLSTTGIKFFRTQKAECHTGFF